MVSRPSLKENPLFECIPCPVCKSRRLKTFLRIPFGKLKQKRSLDYSVLGIDQQTVITVSRCRDCRFVFTNPRIRRGSEGLVYNESKKNLYKDNRHLILGTPENRILARERKLKHWPVLMKVLCLADRRVPLTLLDYGCGFGYTLSLARELGIEGKGIDVDQTRLAYCRQQELKVYTLEEFLAEKNDAAFDLIICESIIEHLTDLDSFMTFIKSVSKDKTILYINGLTPRLIRIEKRKGAFVKAHFLEHINYFHAATLDFFLEKAGLVPLRKDIVLINGRKLLIPPIIAKILKRNKGFFERIYIKRER